VKPHKDGSLGVIDAGAYADVLIVDGDPVADIKIIMKDGVIYKNTLPE
jgi:imidazolonepropionase-like amidohydrolase